MNNIDNNRGNSRASRIRAVHDPADRPWRRTYDRARDLPRLVPVLSEDLLTPTPDAHARLLGLLARALRAERVRARQGHWTYDPARHAALLWAYRIETQFAM